MAKVDKSRQLTIEQENAIDLLLQGKSDREVAEAVGVSRQTVTEWRNRDALFVAELNRRRQEVWGGQTERLRQLVAQAVNVLEEDLQQNQDRKLRQAAAVHILRAVGLYGVNLAPKGATDPEDIEAEWASTKALAESLKELSRLTA
ncbi:MAG: helix-turn-helix domain-containing protein [Syntrophothermus sp.]|uniref:helix-turn-helix domain-containing protein n=1 Tax=Syntrophothermus sp. TaxID=2736299 RepID=UPI0025802A78|nr:helix-turn-helix domain-containing protein [Syntrophothermus sp.]NSW83138.1 helix-turn-helix domain-containing protein [Syntrophothermus sp.]